MQQFVCLFVVIVVVFYVSEVDTVVLNKFKSVDPEYLK